MRMSSEPCEATSSASAMTWLGSRRSSPMTRRRCSQSRAVVHLGEAPDGVLREARRDRRVRAVAQEAQGDVHPDLGPPAGQQGAPPCQVRAGIAALVVERGTRRTELVVEGVDVDVSLLADVTRTRAQERSRRGTVARDVSGRPWVSSSMRPGAPVAVAAVTASSLARIAVRRCARRCSLTVLNSLPTARRTATASGCSVGSCSTSLRTRSASASRSGSMPSM